MLYLTYLSVYDLMTHSDDIEIGDSFQYYLAPWYGRNTAKVGL